MSPHCVRTESHLGGGALMKRKLPARRSIGIHLDARALEAFARDPRRYRFDTTEDDHVVVLELREALPCQVMVSGHPSALYDGQLVICAGYHAICGPVSEYDMLRVPPDRNQRMIVQNRAQCGLRAVASPKAKAAIAPGASLHASSMRRQSSSCSRLASPCFSIMSMVSGAKNQLLAKP